MLRDRTNSEHERARETIPTPGSSDLSPESNSVNLARDLDLTEEELLTFREGHLPDFPLMNIPPDVTAAEVQREKPTLSLAIKALTTKVAAKQGILARKLRKILTQKILIDGERSLPLLLSLLVSIAWCGSISIHTDWNTDAPSRSLSFTHGKPFLGAMIGLARPLISDLKLDRGPTSPRCPGSNPPHLVDNEESVTHTSAGRRAYISCFALSVMYCTTIFPARTLD